MIPQKFDQMIGGDEEPEEIKSPGVVRMPLASVNVDQDKVDELARRYPNGLPYKPAPYKKPDDDDQHLNIDNLIQDDKELREKANFFICSICTMVVMDPLECSGCQTLFCTSCIDPWRANNDCCPKKCKGNEEVEFREVHRYINQEL